jgi:hypothetical protein
VNASAIEAAEKIAVLLDQLPSDEAREQAISLVRSRWCLHCGRRLRDAHDWCFCQNDD